MAGKLTMMPTSPLSVVLQHLLADLGADGAGMTDGELWARFLGSRDEAVLAALVRRHAAMVWGVSRRLLNHHDAEDAFQATFLVLVRKAADVPRQAVANWLYGVARQTAVRLRATAAKRGRREKQVVIMPDSTVSEVRDADLLAVLDEELGRLPGHYRSVVVVCDLEGMTRKEAARQLGIPEGSVASRLARARVMLAKRLTRRGVVFAGVSVATALSAGSGSASAPPALVASTIKAADLLAAGRAAGVISAKVAGLTEGVVRAMFLAKLKTVTCALALTALVVLAGAALVPGGVHLPIAGAAMAPAGDPGALAWGEPAEEPAAQPAEQPAAKPFTIRGKVVDDATGKPVTRFIVQSGNFDPSDPGFDPTDPRKVFWLIGEQPQSAPDGSFSTTIRWAEGRTARIVADGYLRQPILTSAPPADKDEMEVTIRLQRVPEKVRGVVLDHTGKSVKDAAVFAVGAQGVVLAAGQAWSRGWAREGKKDDDARPVLTDTQGRFEIPTNGATLLGVTHARFDAWPAAVPANGEVTIRLPQPARVEIKLDIDGAGKESVIFYQLLSYLSPEFETLQSSRWVTMANPGKLVFDALPPGKYQLYRSGQDGRIVDQHIFDVKGGETKTIDLVRNKGARARGKVTWPAAAKLTSISVSILRDKDNTVFASLSPAGDGSFLTERIPPGTYQVIAYAFEEQTPERLRNTSPIPASFHAGPTKIVVPAEGEVTVADLALQPIKPKNAAPPPAQPKQQADNIDQERILGGWLIVNEDSKRKGEPWNINKDKLYMHANIGGFYPGHFYRLDGGKTPKQVDIFHRQGGDPNGALSHVIKGIYSLDSNETRLEMRLCLAGEGKDRPMAFPEKPAPGEVLILHHAPEPKANIGKLTKEETLRVLIDQVLAAHGGEDKLNKLTSFTMTVKHSNGETQHYFVQPPKNFRWETTHRDRTGKRIVILFQDRGRRWWTKEPNEDAKEFIPLGKEPLSVDGWFDYVKFFGPRQVLRLKDADHKVVLLDEEAKIGDRAAMGVQVTGRTTTTRCTSTRRRTCSSRALAATSSERSPSATTRGLTACRSPRRNTTTTSNPKSPTSASWTSSTPSCSSNPEPPKNLTEGVGQAMYVTKISSVLSPLLLVGLTFGAIGVGGGRSTNPAVVAQEKTPDKGPAKDDKSPESAARKRAEQAELPRAELDLEADHTS